MSLKVDPDALRAWAKWLDGLSGDIAQMADDVTLGYGASFPGTELAATLTDTRDVIKSALTSLASRQTEMSAIARDAGEKYEITDVDFSTQLRAMGGVK
ncbi:hypothetical protein CJ469_04861 [Nocardia farcinica]|uniref:type VII secretion target n=1 Tax=Nocardia farcinica TaxID=37329 RepID=UPI000BF7C795|nr:type VII secretion target [Nocardia farcinica]PFW99827.1 hypothetical protein CJ469_04861 [Nocardia farcinica]